MMSFVILSFLCIYSLTFIYKEGIFLLLPFFIQYKYGLVDNLFNVKCYYPLLPLLFWLLTFIFKLSKIWLGEEPIQANPVSFDMDCCEHISVVFRRKDGDWGKHGGRKPWRPGQRRAMAPAAILSSQSGDLIFSHSLHIHPGGQESQWRSYNSWCAW